MKELRVKLNGNWGLIPEVLWHLSSIQEFTYSYKHYLLRHPGGVFNITANSLFLDFISLLDELQTHQTEFDESRKNELCVKLQNLLNNFFKFYEGCYEIIQGCCKEHSPPRENEFVWQWLKKNKYDAGVNFYDETKSDIEYFRKIHNKLKHSSNAIQPTLFFKETTAVLGFYLQSIAEDGSVGPDEELHPQFQGTHSANSYNFILPRLYYCIYKISDILFQVLIKHFKEIYDEQLSFSKESASSNLEIWEKLFNKVSALPKQYFPNETERKISQITRKDCELIFAMETASETKLVGWNIRLYESGDGFSRSYRLPFFGAKPLFKQFRQ